jgi:hypothetical protein
MSATRPDNPAPGHNGAPTSAPAHPQRGARRGFNARARPAALNRAPIISASTAPPQ